MEYADDRDLLRLLIESVRDYAIFMLDPDGIVTTWNAGAERLKGYTVAEILGRHFSVFYTPEDVAAGKPGHVLERALADGRFEDEAWRVRKDGSRFWANAIVAAIHDGTGRHRGFAKVTRDLTDRRRSEEERLRRAQAEESVRVREEFMSIAAHELRNPLNALQLQVVSLKLMLQRFPDLDRAQAAAKVEHLLHLTARLAGLISRLLDVSRIASGRLELERAPVDLVACAREVIDTLSEKAAAKGVEIRFRGPAEATGHWDPLRIEQVVSNLVENALEWGEGQPVDVVIDADDRFVSLDVVDHGPGIPPEDRERVFDKFASGNPRTFGHGLGLGLYISREIVEAHGGTVQLVDSSGAHFRVRLPRTPAVALAAGAGE